VITWIVLRAAGIAAYLMLFLSVAWGLVGTTTVFGKKVARVTAVSVHQFLSTVAFLLLGVHLGGLLLDQFVPFKPLDILVPLHTSFRPVAVAFGIVAMYLGLVVLLSSWGRKHLSNRTWRALHLLAVPAFALSMVHGVAAGTDTVRPWMWWTYAATGAVIFFLLIFRALSVGIRPQRAALPATARARRPDAEATAASRVAVHEPAPAASPPLVGAAASVTAVVAGSDVVSQLERLDALHRSGALDHPEYEAAKDRVLGKDRVARKERARPADTQPLRVPPPPPPAEAGADRVAAARARATAARAARASSQHAPRAHDVVAPHGDPHPHEPIATAHGAEPRTEHDLSTD
jgi:hypothetical protein